MQIFEGGTFIHGHGAFVMRRNHAVG
jgi:hypothetical protein